MCVCLAPVKPEALRISQCSSKSLVQIHHFSPLLCRQNSISKQWQDLLDQLQRRQHSLGTMQEILGLLRDVDAITEELKELQVEPSQTAHSLHCCVSLKKPPYSMDCLVPTEDKSISYRKNTPFLLRCLTVHFSSLLQITT